MNNIKKLREKKKVSQWTLSAYLEVSQETISAYENNKALPSAKTLLKLADYFDTSVDYILARTKIDLSVDELKYSDFTDSDAIMMIKFKKLSQEKRNKVIGYIDGLGE